LPAANTVKELVVGADSLQMLLLALRVTEVKTRVVGVVGVPFAAIVVIALLFQELRMVLLTIGRYLALERKRVHYSFLIS